MWYHKECFFKKQKPKALGDIAKYDSLRPEDQKFIRDAVEKIGSHTSNNSRIIPQGK